MGVRSRLSDASAPAVLAIATALVVTACASGDPATGSSSSASSSPTDARTAAVVAAYRAYWTELLRASDPKTAESADLPSVAGDPELGRAKQIIDARSERGQLLAGSYAHEEQVELQGDDRARLLDCLTVSTRVLDARTGATVEANPPGPFAVEAAMHQVDGRWRVEDVKAGTATCAPRSSPRPTSSDLGAAR